MAQNNYNGPDDLGPAPFGNPDEDSKLDRKSISSLRGSIDKLNHTLMRVGSAGISAGKELGRTAAEETNMHPKNVASFAASTINPLFGYATQKAMESQTYSDAKGKLSDKMYNMFHKKDEAFQQDMLSYQEDMSTSMKDMNKNVKELYGAIPKAAKGGTVERGGLAKIHTGELIVPKGGSQKFSYNTAALNIQKPTEIRSKVKNATDAQIAMLSKLIDIKSILAGQRDPSYKGGIDQKTKVKQVGEMGTTGGAFRSFIGAAGEEAAGFANAMDRSAEYLRVINLKLGKLEMTVGDRLSESLGLVLARHPVFRTLTRTVQWGSKIFAKFMEKDKMEEKVSFAGGQNYASEVTKTGTPLGDIAANTLAMYVAFRSYMDSSARWWESGLNVFVKKSPIKFKPPLWGRVSGSGDSMGDKWDKIEKFIPSQFKEFFNALRGKFGRSKEIQEKISTINNPTAQSAAQKALDVAKKKKDQFGGAASAAIGAKGLFGGRSGTAKPYQQGQSLGDVNILQALLWNKSGDRKGVAQKFIGDLGYQFGFGEKAKKKQEEKEKKKLEDAAKRATEGKDPKKFSLMKTVLWTLPKFLAKTWWDWTVFTHWTIPKRIAEAIGVTLLKLTRLDKAWKKVKDKSKEWWEKTKKAWTDRTEHFNNLMGRVHDANKQFTEGASYLKGKVVNGAKAAWGGVTGLWNKVTGKGKSPEQSTLDKIAENTNVSATVAKKAEKELDKERKEKRRKELKDKYDNILKFIKKLLGFGGEEGGGGGGGFLSTMLGSSAGEMLTGGIKAQVEH